MKKYLVIAAMASLLVGPTLVFAAGSSENFRVSVTIPAIPGVNVPLLEQQESQITPLGDKVQIIREQIVRDEEEIVLVTLVEE